MNRPTCETCPFWVRSSANDQVLGECRRFPPNLHVEPYFNRGFWRNTHQTDWCGEHPDFPRREKIVQF